MKDTDKLLIGTNWARSKGKHFGSAGTIDSIGSRGPRVKIGGETSQHNTPYVRLVWAELGVTWTPTDRRAERAYELWKMASHIDYLDQKIEKESETELPQNGAVTMETPEVAVKECHGAWHRNSKTNPVTYALLPLTSFGIASRGPNKGQLASVCIDCSTRNKRSPSHLPKKVPVEQLAPVVIEPKVETPEGDYYRWKVTVIQTVEHIVQGKDLLDVAAQVETLGRVVKVEQL